MAEAPPPAAGFRARRVQNWLTLGLTYASFYMGRYNLGVAQKAMSDEFGWSKGDIGWILTAGLTVYAVSTVVNGPLADRFGGKKVLLIGTAGACVANLLFGLGALLAGPLGQSKSWMLGYFVAMFSLNNYFQSFGACSIVKINTAWFRVEERGVFGGIFGGMIQGGRLAILSLGGLIVAYLPWRWVFFIPALVLGIMFYFARRDVVDSPEDAGYPTLHPHVLGDPEGRVSFGYLVKRIFTNPVMLSLALASFCIGFSRQGMDQWMVRYFQEVHHLDGRSAIYQLMSIGAPLLGIAGGLTAGTLSDKLFSARRPPVIFACYVGQLGFFLLLAHAISPLTAVAAILGASFFISGSHSLLAGVSSMDFGGRHAAATAAGLFDGLQYLAGAVTGRFLGVLLDQRGWGVWAYTLMPTALLGAVVMAFLWNAKPGGRAPIAALAGPVSQTA